jgi:hypothetical protein
MALHKNGWKNGTNETRDEGKYTEEKTARSEKTETPEAKTTYPSHVVLQYVG